MSHSPPRSILSLLVMPALFRASIGVAVVAGPLIGCGTAPKTAPKKARHEATTAAALAVAEISGVGPLLEKAERAPVALISHLRTQVKRLDENAMIETRELEFILQTANQAASVFDRKTLLAPAYAVFEALPESERLAAIRYYESPNRVRLDDAISDLGTNRGQRRLMLFLRDLDKHPPLPERLNLIDALVTQSGELDRRVMASFDASHAFFVALAPALPKDMRPNEAVARTERKQFENRARRTLAIELDAVTRPFSTEALAELVRYWQTPEGVAFRLASERAVRLGVEAAAKKATAVVRQRVEERDQETNMRESAANAPAVDTKSDLEGNNDDAASVSSDQ